MTPNPMKTANDWAAEALARCVHTQPHYAAVACQTCITETVQLATEAERDLVRGLRADIEASKVTVNDLRRLHDEALEELRIAKARISEIADEGHRRLEAAQNEIRRLEDAFAADSGNIEILTNQRDEAQKELSALRKKHADTLRVGGEALVERDSAREELRKAREMHESQRDYDAACITNLTEQRDAAIEARDFADRKHDEACAALEAHCEMCEVRLMAEKQRDEALSLIDTLKIEAGRAMFASANGWPLPEEMAAARMEIERLKLTLDKRTGNLNALRAEWAEERAALRTEASLQKERHQEAERLLAEAQAQQKDAAEKACRNERERDEAQAALAARDASWQRTLMEQREGFEMALAEKTEKACARERERDDAQARLNHAHAITRKQQHEIADLGKRYIAAEARLKLAEKVVLAERALRQIQRDMHSYEAVIALSAQAAYLAQWDMWKNALWSALSAWDAGKVEEAAAECARITEESWDAQGISEDERNRRTADFEAVAMAVTGDPVRAIREPRCVEWVDEMPAHWCHRLLPCADHPAPEPHVVQVPPSAPPTVGIGSTTAEVQREMEAKLRELAHRMTPQRIAGGLLPMDPLTARDYCPSCGSTHAGPPCEEVR